MNAIKKKLLISMLLVSISSVIPLFLYYQEPINLPVIQGRVFSKAIPLQKFTLMDHRKIPFTREDLLGQWHIVAYGYTHCPDICPTTLATLSQVSSRIKQQKEFNDLQFIFYTVDPNRDTLDKLAQYIGHFSEGMIALRPSENNSGNTFEKSLGIKWLLTNFGADADTYSVSHGATIYLINPEASLQAIFTPKTDTIGLNPFKVDAIYNDYMNIRRYFLSGAIH